MVEPTTMAVGLVIQKVQHSNNIQIQMGQHHNQNLVNNLTKGQNQNFIKRDKKVGGLDKGQTTPHQITLD